MALVAMPHHGGAGRVWGFGGHPRALGDAPGSVLTQDLADQILATRGSTWTDKELQYLKTNLYDRIGQKFTDDGYGTWSFQDGGGAINTRIAQANNFSAATGDAQQDDMNAFTDTYGNQLTVDYSRFVHNGNGTWTDPSTGATYADVIYQQLLRQQGIIQNAVTTGNVDQARTDINAQALTPELPSFVQAILDTLPTDPGWTHGYTAGPAGDGSWVVEYDDATGHHRQQVYPDGVNPPPTRILDNGVEVDKNGAPVDGGYNAADDAARQIAAQTPAPSVDGSSGNATTTPPVLPGGAVFPGNSVTPIIPNDGGGFDFPAGGGGSVAVASENHTTLILGGLAALAVVVALSKHKKR